MQSHPMWRLEINFTEDDRATRADVVLDVGGHHHHGWGRAKRNPAEYARLMSGLVAPDGRAVLANGDLYLNAGGDLDGTSSGLIDPQTLQTTVAAIVRRNPSIQVLVGGDEGASYGQVYGALALLQAQADHVARERGDIDNKRR